MKLGDSMASIEACNVWNDVCPRKTRPPKIGDIPRHVAIDEESPGCSTTRSLGQFVASQQQEVPKSMIERSTSCQSQYGRSGTSVTLPTIDDFLRSNGISKVGNESVSSPWNSKKSPTGVKDEKLKDSEIENCEKNLLIDDDRRLEKSNTPSVRVSESQILKNDQGSWEEAEEVEETDEISLEIYDRRKDSALYIEETCVNRIEAPSGQDLHEKQKIIKSILVPNARERIEENPEKNLPRPRRESSGYFSNLSTFDEDRWSTMDHCGNQHEKDQQQQLTTREINSRRRSSTKNVNRLPTIQNNQPQTIQETIDRESIIEQTTGSPQVEEIQESSPRTWRLLEDSTSLPPVTQEPGKIGKNIEMPNIDERTSLEFEEDSINFLPQENLDCEDDHDVVSGHTNDRLMNKISQVAVEHRSSRIDEIFSSESNVDFPLEHGIMEKQDDDGISKPDSCESKDHQFKKNATHNSTPTSDKSQQGESASQCMSPRTANRQRRRMIHQYSSPNIANTELERIAETPNRENSQRNELESRLEKDKKNEITSPDPGRPEDIDDDKNDDKRDRVLSTVEEKSSFTEKDPGEGYSQKFLPKSVKVYQLLSTQSEDRGDGDSRLYDRRISLQITRQDEESCRDNIHSERQMPIPILEREKLELVEAKKLIHADSVPILKIPGIISDEDERKERLDVLGETSGSKIFGDSIATVDRSNLVVDNNPAGGSSLAGVRPIYPYCPYSPYASPQGSPRTNRRRPLRESRRVSIDSRQGALQLNQYKLLNTIGQGSFGIVKLAFNEEDETHYAMKILSKKKLMKKAGIFGRIAPGRKGPTNPLAKVYREIALLKKLDHPNVVKLVEVLDDPDEDNLYLVFELVQRGEVLQLPTDRPIDEDTARRHFRDVVMGVEYLHYQRIVHRDIKPSNLLVDSEGTVKVADLGVSAELRASGELLTGSAGTPAFAAPETTSPGAQYSGTLCDVWSMGVTLYSLVIGKVPWDGSGSIIGVQAAVRSEQLRFPENPNVSDHLRDLVLRMLAKDPTKRICLAEIKEHPWLTRDGEEPLPSEADNCRLPVTVTDEEVARVVTRVPKLDTLILIKTMLKQHSFQNPFLPRRATKSAGQSTEPIKQQSSIDTNELSSKETIPSSETVTSKSEQFHRAGRSNSAPDTYDWQPNARQISNDALLPPLTESSNQETEVEKR